MSDSEYIDRVALTRLDNDLLCAESLILESIHTRRIHCGVFIPLDV